MTQPLELTSGCGPKTRRLADALLDVRKRVEQAWIEYFEFLIWGHTE